MLKGTANKNIERKKKKKLFIYFCVVVFKFIIIIEKKKKKQKNKWNKMWLAVVEKNQSENTAKKNAVELTLFWNYLLLLTCNLLIELKGKFYSLEHE